MDGRDSPGVARRRVRLALRQAREAAGLTQADVAARTGWSLSKVIRIESGDVAIAPSDLRPLLGFLQVRDDARVAALVEAARAGRSRPTQWYRKAACREHLTDALRLLIEYESAAGAIHSYSTFHVPGLLQIPEYSEALTSAWRAELTPDQIDFRLTARRLRRAAVLQRIGSLHLTALIDESVLWRLVGGPQVLRAQLVDLLRLSRLGGTAVRVIRFSADLPMFLGPSFDILFLDADGDLSDAVLYRETGTHDEILEDTAAAAPATGLVARHFDRYRRLWRAAESTRDTEAFLERRIRDLA